MQTTDAYQRRRQLLMAEASRIVTNEDTLEPKRGDYTYLGLSLSFLASELEGEMALLESAITTLNQCTIKD